MQLDHRESLHNVKEYGSEQPQVGREVEIRQIREGKAKKVGENRKKAVLSSPKI